jgi:hypothetical protein
MNVPEDEEEDVSISKIFCLCERKTSAGRNLLNFFKAHFQILGVAALRP